MSFCFALSVLFGYVSAQSYCVSGVGPLNVHDGNLGPVSLEGMSKSSIQDKQNCPGQLGVIDLTTSQEADVRLGGSFTLSMEITSCSTLYEPIAGNAWIDWNQNGLFEDNERLSQGNVVGYQMHDIPFSVPKDAVLGSTRMRVQVQETTQPSVSLDPCSNFRWGGTKDYTITVHKNNNYSIVH